MEKQVPEEANRDSELANLLAAIGDNQAYQSVVGLGRNRLVELLGNMLDEAASPTNLLSRFDEMCGNLRVVVNQLGKLRRDGNVFAEAELLMALEQTGYVLPGQVIEKQKTAPVTILMLDPVRTFAMLKWIFHGHWMNLNDVLDGADAGPLAADLFARFQTLRQHSEQRRSRGDYEGCDLCSAYRDTVLEYFDLPNRKLPKLVPLALYSYTNQYNDHLEISGMPFAFAFQAEQSEVLEAFERSEQRQIATWQLRLPKALFESGFEVAPIGFYPESEIHTLNPGLTSCGASNGLVCQWQQTIPETTQFGQLTEDETLRFFLRRG